MDCPEIKISVFAERGDTEGVARCLALGADPESYNNEPFRRACKYGHLAVVKQLLSAGVDLNRDKNLGFEYAARGYHAEIVDFLLFDTQLVSESRAFNINRIMADLHYTDPKYYSQSRHFGYMMTMPSIFVKFIELYDLAKIYEKVELCYNDVDHPDALAVLASRALYMPHKDSRIYDSFHPLWLINHEKRELGSVTAVVTTKKFKL